MAGGQVIYCALRREFNRLKRTIMTDELYRKSRNYETLIKRAFNCEKGRKHGADSNLFMDLVALEQCDRHSIKYRWKFQKMKNYLAKALFKLRKRKRYLESDNEFSPILIRLNQARNVEDLAKIASSSLAKIIECERRLLKRSDRTPVSKGLLNK